MLIYHGSVVTLVQLRLFWSVPVSGVLWTGFGGCSELSACSDPIAAARKLQEQCSCLWAMNRCVLIQVQHVWTMCQSCSWVHKIPNMYKVTIATYHTQNFQDTILIHLRVKNLLASWFKMFQAGNTESHLIWHKLRHLNFWGLGRGKWGQTYG